MTGLEARKCATANPEGKMKLMLCPPQFPGSQPLRVLLSTHLSSLFLLSSHSAGGAGTARCWGYRGKSSMAPALLRQKDRQLSRYDSQEAVGVGRGCGQGRLGERELTYLRKGEGPPEAILCRVYLVQTSPSFCRGINGSPEKDNDLSRRSSRAKIPLQL